MVSSPPRSKLSPPRNRLLHAEPPKSRIEKQLFHNDEAAVVDTSCNNKETAKPDAHVRVIARIRPMNHIEAKRGCKRCIYEEDRKENHMPPAVVEGGTSNSFLSRLKSSFTSPTTTTLNNSDTPEKFDEGIVLADATPLVSNMSSRLQSSSTLHTQHSDTNITPPNHKKSSSMPTRLIAESNNTTRTFEFDAVLPPTASQRDVYEAATGNNIRANLLHGYNTTILAYGQTGSGKTYTMGGLRDARALAGEALSPAPANQHSSNSNNEQDGVIARAIRELFLAKQEQESNGLQVTIRLSCLEIYQDELRDLMVESQQQLQMRDHGNDVTVQGLTCVQVKSVNQVQALMEQATLRRTTAATRLNERSSRSHAICTLSITTTTAAGRGAAATKKPLKARLTLVDLVSLCLVFLARFWFDSFLRPITHVFFHSMTGRVGTNQRNRRGWCPCTRVDQHQQRPLCARQSRIGAGRAREEWQGAHSIP